VPAIIDFNAPHDGWLHPPLLAQLALRLFGRNEDKAFISEIFQSLLAFYERWFSSEHDRDQDGFPEWDHVNQAGFKTWPAFSPWFGWSKGLDLSTAETVDLATMLILEGEALISIASVIGVTGDVDDLRARIDLLKERIEDTWIKGAGYKHVDYYLHESVSGKRLGVRRGSFNLDVDREFDPAVRVLFQIEGEQGDAHDLLVRIHSRGRRGPSRVEEYNFRKVNWFLNYGYLTSEKPSAEIEKIELEGVDRAFKTTVSLGDYARDDVNLLLPLAAALPSKDRADVTIHELLSDVDRYWRPGGIPSVPADDAHYAGAEGPLAGTISMLRNHWIAEGLLYYGHRQEAGELFSNLMGSVVNTLRSEHAFSARYDAERARIIPDKDSPAGLTPFALLMEILGVEIINPRKLRVRAGSPFTDPIRLHWKGLQIVCESDRTLVIFPDGQVTEVVGETLQLVEQVG
jgi:hypothetical protein